mmetsp:Transcript_39021/g.91271  ORF Transcript_39021/g.91271 Transcript_39021/m.91271 type:complete len:264 (-) Transcript_39021:213-1004(-)
MTASSGDMPGRPPPLLFQRPGAQHVKDRRDANSSNVAVGNHLSSPQSRRRAAISSKPAAGSHLFSFTRCPLLRRLLCDRRCLRRRCHRRRGGRFRFRRLRGAQTLAEALALAERRHDGIESRLVPFDERPCHERGVPRRVLLLRRGDRRPASQQDRIEQLEVLGGTECLAVCVGLGHESRHGDDRELLHLLRAHQLPRLLHELLVVHDDARRAACVDDYFLHGQAEHVCAQQVRRLVRAYSERARPALLFVCRRGSQRLDGHE